MSAKKVAKENVIETACFTSKEFELAKATAVSVLGEKVNVELIDDGETIRIGYVTGLAVDEVTVVGLHGGSHKRRQFSLLKFVYSPGVRYYADGSGEPPSEDCESVGAPDVGFGFILAKACAQHIENEVFDFLQAKDEEEWVEQEEQAEAEIEAARERGEFR